MGPFPSIILLLKLVSFLVSSSSALKCYVCRFDQKVAEGIKCSFGGTEFPVTEAETASRQDLEEVAIANTNKSKGAGATEVEACVTFYGTSESTGLYFVQRGKIKTKAALRDCQENPLSLNTLCICDTDLCNDKVPPSIMKCHLCVHNANEPNQGCVSGTDTFKTVARSAGNTNEENAAAMMSKTTEVALDLRKTPNNAGAGRQNADKPNKYQKCFFFEGTQDGVEALVRAKAYFPEDFNGCFESPKPYNGIHGRFCYCSKELCNSQPGTPGGFKSRSPSAGGASIVNVHSLGFYAFVMGLLSVM